MTEHGLPLERFAMLADAYGAAIARWPATERAAALRLAATPEGRAILARAERLDIALDRWTVPAPTEALRGAVLAGAPQADVRARLKLWWSGIGIAAALAGAAAGSVAAAAVASPDHAGDNPTAFGDLSGEES